MMRVLVVDDEADIREIIRDELSLSDFEIEEADGGHAALDRLRAGGIDAIISDISMANGSGLDLLKGARALSAEKPAIILVSGFSEVTHINAFDLGVDCMLPKPFELRDITDSIRRTTTSRELRWRDPPPARAAMPLIIREVKGAISHPQSASFGIGRGGFRVTASHAKLNVGSAVRYEIRFSDGPVPKLDGTGWIRWHRHEPDPALGVEIETLSSDCLGPVLDVIRESPLGTPYIPKGGLTPAL